MKGKRTFASQWLLVLLMGGSGVMAIAEPGADSVWRRAEDGASAFQADDEEPSEKVLVQRQIAILRSRKSAPDERAAAVDELLNLGTRGPAELARHLGAEFESAHKKNAKAFAKLITAFDKLAPKLIEKRVSRKAQAALDENRGVIMRNARNADLTKDEIKASSDKAYDAIVELLTIRPADVWDAAPDLYDDWVELLDVVDVEAALRSDWDRAKDALLAAGPDGVKLADRLKAPKGDALSEDVLLAAIRDHAEMSRPMSKADRKAFDTNAALAADPEKSLLPEEVAGVRDLNLRLVLIGLPAQTIDVKLCAACRDHSKDMDELSFFSHTSPVDGKESFGDRASNFGTSAGSENIAMGASTGGGAIMQWWYSPGHHRNMLGGATRVGLGRHRRHWTQNFG